VVLDLLHDLAQAAELALAVGGEGDRVAAAVVRVAAALDQAALLEVVEEADELAAVELQGVAIDACVSDAPSASRARTL
jgi:hypothetical protein